MVVVLVADAIALCSLETQRLYRFALSLVEVKPDGLFTTILLRKH